MVECVKACCAYFSKIFRCWIRLDFGFLACVVLLLCVAIMFDTEVVSEVDM